MEALFSLANLLIMPFWLAMIFLPRWSVTRRVMASQVPIALLAVLYGVLVIPRMGGVWSDLARPELPAIARLLGTPEGAAIGWIHFLAFDLFVGRWIYLDSRDRDASPWLVGPVLMLTLMFGPLGYLAYLGLRTILPSSRVTREESPAADTPVPGPRYQRAVKSLLALLGKLWEPVAFLTATGLAALVLSLPALAGVLLDPRVITGSPAWLKPFKFILSSGIYSLTLAWLLSMVDGRRRVVATVSNVTATALIVELLIVVLQASRGTTSHFNVATPLDSLLWRTMGGFIVALWLAALTTTALISFQRLQDRTFAWTLRLGMLITFIGMGQGFLMAPPSAEQLAAGSRMVVQGAHSVGVPDGGPGLPLVGWSTVGGDMRVGHFLGLHALQFLPLAAWLLGRTRLAERQRTGLVVVAGGGYLSLFMLVTWQALRGQPLLAPDALTLTALGGLIVAIVAGAVLALLRGEQAHLRTPLLQQ